MIADSGDHASILDGCLLSRAKLRAFRHNRLDKLEKALDRAANDGGGVLVVVDGVFSMEGDVPPLPEIVALCEAHGARLMVDEAHGAGVLGARGAGASELFGVEDRVDLTDGHVLQVAGLLRRLHRRLARGRRLPAHPVARVPVHRRGGAGRRRGRARRAAGRALGGRPAAVRPGARQRALPRGRPARARLPRDPHAADHADHPGAGRGRLEGRAAVARALRRGRVRQRRAAPRGAAGRRAAAHERDGHARPRDARPRAAAFGEVKQAFEAEHGPLPAP